MSKLAAGFRGFPPRLWIVALAAALTLAAAGAGVPQRFSAAIDALSHIRNAEGWTRASQERLGRDVHDALVAADTLLPRKAAVFLVTPGRDVRRSEYIAFHRALYVLAPRPVWWAASATRDGSWESRWFIATTPVRDTIVRRARERGASHVLAFGGAEWISVDDNVIELPGNARLIMLDSAGALPSDRTEWRAAPSPAGAIAGLVLIFLAGLVVYTILARNESASLPRAVAISWLLGCAAISLAMFWMIRFGVTPVAQRIAIAVPVIVGSLWIMRTCAFRVEKIRGSVSILTVVLAVWLLAEIAGLLIRSAAGPLAGWDGWVTWAMKARVLHLQHDSAALLMDASREIANRSYPLLLPLTESWIFGWVGAADDRFAAIVTMSFLLALVTLLVSGLRPKIPLVFTLAITVAFVTTPYAGFLASLGYADIALAAYALAAVLALRGWIENSDKSIRLTAFLSGLLPWVKTEGFILLAAILIGACVAVHNGRLRRRLIGSVAIATLICAGPWYLLVATSDISHGVFSRFPDVTMHRAAEIIFGFASRAVAIEWHGIWLASFAVISLMSAKRQWRMLLPVTIGVYLSALAISFFFSLYEPLAQHVLRSADRLLLHVTPLALLMVADVMTPHRRASSATAAPAADHR